MSSHILEMVQSAKVAFDNMEEAAEKENSIPLISFKREASFALQILTNNNFLAGMNPSSIVSAIKNVALCGITLNPAMKLAYLVPRDGKCCLDISYMGLVKIATDSGSVLNVSCQLVYEEDEFSIEYGSEQKLAHKPDPFHSRGELIGVYTIAKMHDGSEMIETMSKDDVGNIKKRSKAFASGKKCPWLTDEGEMTRKTCIKRASKYWTKTERLSTAIQVVNEHEGVDFNKENIVDITPTVNEVHFYPQSSFDKNFPKWEKLIAEGKNTCDEIVSLLSTKATLTDEQKNMIKAVASPVEVKVEVS